MAPADLARIFDSGERPLRIASMFLPCTWPPATVFATGIYSLQYGPGRERVEARSLVGWLLWAVWIAVYSVAMSRGRLGAAAGSSRAGARNSTNDELSSGHGRGPVAAAERSSP